VRLRAANNVVLVTGKVKGCRDRTCDLQDGEEVPLNLLAESGGKEAFH
jgi:hypothetical protein